MEAQMKKSFRFLLTSIFILFLGVDAFSQSHEMYLPAPTQATYINQIIVGDTLQNGSRADTDRVYVLQRGGVWFYNGTINSIGWAVRIKAEDGPGPKPIIYASVASGESTVASNFIDAEGDVYLKNIVVNGIFDLDTAYTDFTYGSATTFVLYAVAGNYSMVVDSCVFANASSAELKIQAAIRSIRSTNNIFTNYGVIPVSDVGNGRAIELRNVSCDTLYVVNNTFVNGFDRVIRHIASTGRIQNVVFDHNTIINDAGTYGVIALGLVGPKVEIRDNLFVDPMVSASDTVAQRQYDFAENGESFSSAFPAKSKQVWIYSQKADSGFVTNYDILDNYWYNTPQIQAVWAQMKSQYDPLLKPAPILTNLIASQVADTSTAFMKLDTISFANTPKPMVGFAKWFLTPVADGGSGEYNSGGNFVPQDRRTTIYYRDTMNCSYSTSSPAYTGASNGFPAGDLNWFPDKLRSWEQLTDIRSVGNITPAKYSLEQNYPNPFNPSTIIRFSIPEANRVSLKVYNLLGQNVATLINENLNAGSHEVSFNAENLSSGVYFYTLQSGTFTLTKKMILMK
jgi:Secretion system C-terminal sorting domain